MRCPECQQRNSVSSSSCKFCGAKFPRKSMKTGTKIALGIFGVAVAGTIALTTMGTHLSDPGAKLTEAAKRMANGPKNLDDAKQIKTEFDDSLKKLLQKFGSENSATLTKHLQQSLPSTPFEVHVADLPRGLKLVEIDTLLQTSDFLVMKPTGNGDVKVFALPEFEVFEDARVLSDQAGPVLVLLGHSAGQMPHRPLIRTYALLPEDIVDETDKIVPLIKGDGQAKFARGCDDILAEISALSAAEAEKITFQPAPPGDTGVIRQRMIWKDARLLSEIEKPEGLYAAAFLAAKDKKKPGEGARVTMGTGGNFAVTLASGSSWGYKAKKAGNAWVVGTSTQLAEAPPEIKPAEKPVIPPQIAAAVQNPPEQKPVTKPAPVETVVPESKPLTKPEDKGDKKSDYKSNDKKVEDKKVADKIKNDKDKKNKDEQKKIAAKPEEKKHDDKPKEEPKQPEETADTSSVGGYTGPAKIPSYLSSNSVRLRSGPGLKSDTINEIPKGADVNVLGSTNGWYKVSYNGNTGYVYGGLLELKKSGNVSTPSPSASLTTAVVTRSMTVRDSRRRSLGRPQVGDRLVILSGIRNNKYKVQLSDGRVGWVDKEAIDVKVETPDLVP